MEQAAFDLVRRLLAKHAPALELYARGWCDTPEDIVQEALLRLAAQRPLPERPVPWLYRAVRNGAMSAGRAARRRRLHEQSAARGSAWFESSLDEVLDARQAAEALHTLPDEEREVVVARLWGGLTYEEISELVGCSSSAAHRRYVAGLARLREMLGEACPNQNSTRGT